MNIRRLLLLLLSGLLIVGALVLATVDLHADQQNCGSALLARDTADLGVDTGNVANDDFATQEVLDDCAHSLLGVRILCGAMVVTALGSWLFSRRKPRHLQLPGGPIL